MPCFRQRFLISLSVFSVCFVSARGQDVEPVDVPSGPDAAMSNTAVEIPVLLDQILLDLRESEAKGPNWQEAFARARTRLDLVRKRDPRNVRAEYYLARVLILEGRSNLGINRLLEWTKSRHGATDWEGHYILGKVYFDTEYYKLAKPVLEKAMELNPRAAEICSVLCKCETKLLKPQEAVRRAEQAVRLLGPDATADTFILVAEAHALNEDLSQAEVAARTAHDLAERAVRKQGSSSTTLKKLDECIRLVLSITQSRINVEPDNVKLFLEMSRLIQEQADVASELAAHSALQWTMLGIQRSGTKPPTEVHVIDVLTLLKRVGRLNDAAKFAERGLEFFPQSSRIAEIQKTLPPVKEIATPDAKSSAAADGYVP